MRHPYQTSYRITSPYGTRIDPLTGEANSFHGGLDLVGEDKTVVSVADGVVLQSRRVTDPANRTSEWGNYVAIVCVDGLVVYYCHLAERLVSVGERVMAGDPIGIEGATGRVTGVHLHFEVRREGIAIDPTPLLGIPNTIGVVSPPPPDCPVWASDAVAWATANGILRGDADGHLHLGDPCTRAEAVVMLHRLAQLQEKQGKGGRT